MVIRPGSIRVVILVVKTAKTIVSIGNKPLIDNKTKSETQNKWDLEKACNKTVRGKMCETVQKQKSQNTVTKIVKFLQCN